MRLQSEPLRPSSQSPTQRTSLRWAQEPGTRSAMRGLRPVSRPPVTMTPRCVPGRLISSTKVVPHAASSQLELEPRLDTELCLRLVGALEKKNDKKR